MVSCNIYHTDFTAKLEFYLKITPPKWVLEYIMANESLYPKLGTQHCFEGHKFCMNSGIWLHRVLVPGCGMVFTVYTGTCLCVVVSFTFFFMCCCLSMPARGNPATHMGMSTWV